MIPTCSIPVAVNLGLTSSPTLPAPMTRTRSLARPACISCPQPETVLSCDCWTGGGGRRASFQDTFSWDPVTLTFSHQLAAAHLKEEAAVPWQCLNFDFTGVVFDGGDFRGVRFSNCKVGFSGAKFSGHTVDLARPSSLAVRSTSARLSSLSARSASEAPDPLRC
jgi:hypothetical protein